MSQQNVNTTAPESKESSFSKAEPAENVSYDAIRRAFRRNLFYVNYPQFNVNTAALRCDLNMHIGYMVAATFTRDEAVFGTGKYRSSTELLFINPTEKLLITVSVYAPKAGAAPETYDTRVVHAANPIGDEGYEESTEYQTTNVYKSAGLLNVAALELFWSEHEGLKKHAQANLPKGDEYSPFCHWQFSRLKG